MSGSRNKIKKLPVLSENAAGFSLIETIVALVILLVSIMGIFSVFAYSSSHNTGNSMRSQALSVLQKEAELMRSAKFTPTVTDNYAPTTPDDGRRDITGGTKTARTVTAVDGSTFTVETIVDNDPLTAGIQATNETTTTLKEITLTVTPQRANGNWVLSYPAKVVFRRVRAN